MGKSLKSNHKYSLEISGKGSYLASQYIDDILKYFHIDYCYSGNMIIGKCPIHNGDNTTAFNLYPDVDNGIPCVWVCNTKKCHTKYKQNIYGLVQALLQKTNKNTTYEQAMDWVMNFVGLTNEKSTSNYIEHTRFDKIFKIKRGNVVKEKWIRQDIRKGLVIPADYYLKRKYSANILNKYDVGLHKKCGRIYIPVYDNDYKFAIGFVSRSPYEKCDKCGKHHDKLAECPKEHNKIYEKWVNSPAGFNKGNFLFNYWFAKPYLKQNKLAILVEGPGDILKLEDNNIHNGVATFGISLSQEQKSHLERLGVTNIVCLYDNDDAGQHAKEVLERELRRSFNLYFPSFTSKDIGDATTEELNFIKDYIIKL